MSSPRSRGSHIDYQQSLGTTTSLTPEREAVRILPFIMLLDLSHPHPIADLIATLKVTGKAGGLVSTNQPKAWKNAMKRFQRPASVSLEAFLLPTDDPRVSRARLSKSTEKLTKGGSTRALTPWALCETRHYRQRDEEELGPLRALTRWQDGGGKPFPVEGLWRAWLGCQVERICDLMDINSLRLAKEMVDARESFSHFRWCLASRAGERALIFSRLDT